MSLGFFATPLDYSQHRVTASDVSRWSRCDRGSVKKSAKFPLADFGIISKSRFC
jgi:hypothetical protein